MTKYIFLFLLISLTACNKSKDNNNIKDQEIMETTTKLDTATFGSGCFWCSEAIFERVKGVHKVISGYAGGSAENPSYEQVCTGKTGHAEVCQIMFDPSVVSFADLLKIFWKTHDPTTLNRQGADAGTQYRSVIFYHSDEQKKIAEYYKLELAKSGSWEDPIVTEISPFTKFYSAEEYHQNYFANNPTQGYCSFVIAPKVEKFEKVFKEKLK
ncbi:MAG: peptide-methionine (S)-S-oxide reductase MsrA [Ignavibacteriaceae bacterium]|nr:peptide-methionine (S)-S-oxide reductase MsrA [Ignavibacteriaceae bacterium]